MARTAELPGVENKLEDISKQASYYAMLRDKRLSAQRVELNAKADLIALMITHELQTYHDSEEGFTVELEQGEVNVKVKKDKEEE
jgi:hypothetical protein